MKNRVWTLQVQDRGHGGRAGMRSEQVRCTCWEGMLLDRQVKHAQECICRALDLAHAGLTEEPESAASCMPEGLAIAEARVAIATHG